ncbi:MAG: DUF1638 domain-containing protein [Alphaproteobacteria bacterium]|nr:DUF1638 domain-containing protein [Alphaproteobacteria bacterium]
MTGLQTRAEHPTTLVICCGAVAREIVGIVKANGWHHMRVECLPAKLHNEPEALPEGVRAKIKAGRERYDHIMVLYSDCGTGGLMETMLTEEGIDGIGGAHCYEVFAGREHFKEIMAEEPGCFFLTDFLARHFEKLVFQGLGLDRFPGLRDTYFAHYKKMIYLAQTENAELLSFAEQAADSVGLDFEVRYTGVGGFETFLAARQP